MTQGNEPYGETRDGVHDRRAGQDQRYGGHPIDPGSRRGARPLPQVRQGQDNEEQFEARTSGHEDHLGHRDIEARQRGP